MYIYIYVCVCACVYNYIVYVYVYVCVCMCIAAFSPFQIRLPLSLSLSLSLSPFHVPWPPVPYRPLTVIHFDHPIAHHQRLVEIPRLPLAYPSSRFELAALAWDVTHVAGLVSDVRFTLRCERTSECCFEKAGKLWQASCHTHMHPNACTQKMQTRSRESVTSAFFSLSFNSCGSFNFTILRPTSLGMSC